MVAKPSWVFLKNASNQPLAQGFKLKITSRDAKIKVYQDWIDVPRIAAGQPATVEFYLMCTQRGDFSGNVFDVQVKDQAGVVVFNSPFNVPIASAR